MDITIMCPADRNVRLRDFVYSDEYLTLPPLSVGAFRALLSTVTNLVLMWRTWAIWGRNRVRLGFSSPVRTQLTLFQHVLYMMLVVLIPTTVFSYGFLFDQRPITRNGACTAVSGKTVFGQKWTFALANMVSTLHD